MTTALQAQSNARNAQRSTGPHTEAGKAAAARNSLRYGYCAADVVMPDEDRAAFDALVADLRRTWAPVGRDQEELVDEIAAALWRRRRLRRVEGDLWAERCQAESGASRTLGQALAHDCDSPANALEKLRRWWVGNERHLARCQDRLALMKRLSRQHPRAAMESPHPVSAQPPPATDRGPAPNGIGFSAERTQSMLPSSGQSLARPVALPGIPLTPISRTLTTARTRRERRALERAQRRAVSGPRRSP